MRAKLGLTEADDVTGALIDDLLTLLHAQAVDYTSCFRALSASLRGDAAPAHTLFAEAFCVRRLGGPLARATGARAVRPL